MQKDIGDIKIHLAEIKVDLRHHIKRTEMLESEVREWRRDMEPVQKHVTIVAGIGKVLIFTSILSTAIVAILSLYWG